MVADLSRSTAIALNVDGDAYGPGYAIGFLSAKDAFTVTGNSAGALSLTYDGVPYSTNAVQNGQYSLWGYVRLNHRSGINASLTTFKGNLAEAIPNYLGSGTGSLGIPVPSMTVQRSVDGGSIGTRY